MSQKAHGTTERPVQTNLRWNVDRSNADRICSYNRHYAEYAGYWKSKEVTFLKEAANANSELTYYDSARGPSGTRRAVRPQPMRGSQQPCPAAPVHAATPHQ